MTSVRKAMLFGFLMWLIPFVTAFIIFPLRESQRPLFESIMPVAVTVGAVVLGVLYFRDVAARYRREGLLLGLIWLAMSLAIDMPLMLLGGPMQMTLGEYLADIGTTYLIIPAVTLGLGVALATRARQGAPQ